jgi:solute:Na+ symporter, SSS family
LLIAFAIYIVVLYGLAWRAAQAVHTVEDFVLAGRCLPLGISAMTLVATWFGTESMLTVTNEVAASGIRQAVMDPVGIAVCLALAGSFLAGPIWRMQIATLGDFFRLKYGPTAEKVSTWIIVPSYFGWIATQMTALAMVLQIFLGCPFELGIVLVAIIGSGYCLLGGMLSVSWIDVFQLVLIAFGLIILTGAAVWELTETSWSDGMSRVWWNAPRGHWHLSNPESMATDWSLAIGALAIGALGNLPTQDLFQRILASKSDRIAIRACWIAAIVYLGIGSLPVIVGMVAACLGNPDWTSAPDILSKLAIEHLNFPAQVAFLLAILSAALSTFASAVMSPAALVSFNLLTPMLEKSQVKLSQNQQLTLQRGSIVVIVVIALGVCFLGRSAYELLQASYAVCFVSLTVPLLVGIYANRLSEVAAVICMLVGFAVWALHFFLDWSFFLQPWLEARCPLPQECVAGMLGGMAYWLVQKQVKAKLSEGI